MALGMSTKDQSLGGKGRRERANDPARFDSPNLKIRPPISSLNVGPPRRATSMAPRTPRESARKSPRAKTPSEVPHLHPRARELTLARFAPETQLCLTLVDRSF